MSVPPEPARVEIRTAMDGDAPGILACLAAAFDPYRQQYSPEAYADTTLTPQTIRARLTAMTVLVAVVADEVVGTIACNVAAPAEGHLRGMAVLRSWQGHGLAERLLQAAEDDLRARGCTRVTLDTTAPLQRAIRFYTRLGYQPSGTVGNFFGMPLFEYEKKL